MIVPDGACLRRSNADNRSIFSCTCNQRLPYIRGERKDVPVIEWIDAKLISIVILSISTGISIYFEVMELLFYKRAGWDFNINSNIGPFTMYKGDSSHESDTVSNKDRVLFSWPLVIVIQFAILVPFVVSKFF
jgi:hypothetical protein